MRLVLLILLLGLLVWAILAPAPSPPSARLVWIPLDSRPVNTSEVALLGAAGGLQVLMPPAADLDRHAAARSNFPALLAWLKQASQEGDTQVIYTNSLLAGGLIASRDEAMYADLEHRLGALRQTLSELPPGQRILVHVLPRLLPTQFSGNGAANPDYAWADELAERSGLIHRLAVHRSRTDEARLAALDRLIPAQARQRYDRLIQINEGIARTLLDWTAEGLVSRLVIGLDDAGPYGMANLVQQQAQRRAYLLGIGDRVFRHLGADEIGFLVVARQAVQHAGVAPALSAHFDREQAQGSVLPFEGGTLGESVAEKMRFLGALSHPGASQQLFLHTVTAQRSPGEAGRTVSQIARALRDGRSVTLVDVTSPRERDAEFLHRLERTVPLGSLHYSAWNTASNALGTGMAMAAVADLHRQAGATPRQVLALETFQAVRLSYDLVYQSHVAELSRWARRQGIDPTNFGAGAPRMEAHLQESVLPEIESLLTAVLGGRQVEAQGRIYSVCVDRPSLSFPWDRTFEIDVRPVIRLVDPRRTTSGGPCLADSQM